MNPPPSDLRPRIVAAVALICCAFALAAFAMSKEEQKKLEAKCDAAWRTCYDVTCKGYVLNDWLRCTAQCDGTHTRCLKAIGLTPEGTPPPRIGGLPPNPTPTPRKGPGKISGLPESNPTPTPRKNPGKVWGGSSGSKSNPAPTTSPSGPVLLAKPGKASPTPTPKPHKSGSH